MRDQFQKPHITLKYSLYLTNVTQASIRIFIRREGEFENLILEIIKERLISIMEKGSKDLFGLKENKREVKKRT